MNILIITKTLINDHDGASLSLRNWLHGAFPNAVAQIYSGIASNEQPKIPSYQIQASDRRLGRFFSFFKNRVQKKNGPRKKNIAKTDAGAQLGLARLFVIKLFNYALSLGLWEIVFKPRISSELDKFIREFKPDVIIAQGFDLGFTWLPVLIHERFGVPITTIIVDDWAPHLYKSAPRITGMGDIVHNSFYQLLVKSDRRYCISTHMAKEYEERYGMKFEVLMQVDHRAQLNAGKANPLDCNRFVVAYSGSLGLKRWEGLRDLADALSILELESINGELHVYAPSLPMEAYILQHHPKVKILPCLTDADVLPVLSSADVVFLPESFDREIRNYIRLSVSTKAHLYMMTGATPLVYGPPEIGTVSYAKEEGWGVVVDKPGVFYLARSLRNIVKSDGLRDRTVATALAVFRRNHSPNSYSLSSLLPSIEKT